MRTKKFSFRKPAIYKIEVYGVLNESLSERLRGLQIVNRKSEGEDSLCTLIGQINDQSALSGILNTLYDNHITIVSVNLLEESDE